MVEIDVHASHHGVAAQHEIPPWRGAHEHSSIVAEPLLAGSRSNVLTIEQTSDTIQHRQFSTDRSRGGDGIPFWRAHDICLA